MADEELTERQDRTETVLPFKMKERSADLYRKMCIGDAIEISESTRNGKYVSARKAAPKSKFTTRKHNGKVYLVCIASPVKNQELPEHIDKIEAALPFQKDVVNTDATLPFQKDIFEELRERLARIETALLFQKKVLNADEVCKVTGFAKSYLYKLTSAGSIPYSQPTGKVLFFDREKVEAWMLSNSTRSASERDITASTYVTTGKIPKR
jgi:excisionase family DNA binding protein